MRQENTDNVFLYNESNAVTTLDPAFSRDLEIIWATNQLYDGLVELDSDLHVIPCIAKSWEIDSTKTTYTFHLRKDVVFHQNQCFQNNSDRLVNANDFVYTFNRILDSTTASPGAWIFSAVNRSKQGGFFAPNDSTLIIHLKEPFYPFLATLSMQYCNVVPQEAVEYYGADFRAHPVGTGPFQFAFWYENMALVFHKNPDYWQRDEQGKRLPYLDAVKIDLIRDKNAEYQGLLQGRYDFMSGIHSVYKDELLDPSGELKAIYQSKIRLQKKPFIKTDYIGFALQNTQSPFADKEIRQAIAYSINKSEMVHYLRNNTVIAANSGFVPPSLSGNAAILGRDYDPSKADSILRAKGFAEGAGLPPLALASTSDYADLLEFIQYELGKKGIRVEIKIMQGPAFREATAKGQIQSFRKSWLADFPDASNFLSLFYSKNFSPSGPNYTHFKNPEFDRLYEQLNSESDPKNRDRIVRKMLLILDDEMPAIPLYYDQVSHFLSNRIAQFETNGVNLIDLRKVRKSHETN